MARKALGERRIGHTGTLDPMAEGLLLLCVGQATRLQQYLMRWDKTYRGVIELGHATNTYDAEGEPMEPSGEPPDLTGSALERLERMFSGTIEQVPPPYSAKKIAGKKLYELARTGQATTAEAKTVSVRSLRLELTAPSTLAVEATTSTGFYVRTLAHDLGVEIGCGGHLRHLTRTAIGPYTAADALPQQALEDAEDPNDITSSASWIPIERANLPFPDISLNSAAIERFVHGQEVIVFRSGSEPIQSGSEVVVFGPSRRLIGIGMVQAVLARGRTVNVRPVTVLQASATDPAERPGNDPTVARGETS
jgi:tRNA pseudouridine55 synthase